MKRTVCALLCILCILSGCSVPDEGHSVQELSGVRALTYAAKHPHAVAPSWIPQEIPDIPLYRPTDDYPEPNTAWTARDEIAVGGKYADFFPVVTNETPLEIMISEIDNPYFIITWTTNTQYLYPYDYERYQEDACPSLERIVLGEPWLGFPYRLPMNFLRMTGPGQYYTVCRQKDGGYVYLFFDRPRSMQDYGVYSSQDKTNIFLHGVLYAEKKLAYEDFASIEIGDNIENVIAIDPAAALCKTLYNLNTALYGEEHYFDYRAVSSLHLLTDGILEVRYLIQDEGELTVDKLFYYPDYQYMSSGYHRITGNKVYMNLTVFPQDFPSA